MLVEDRWIIVMTRACIKVNLQLGAASDIGHHSNLINAEEIGSLNLAVDTANGLGSLD